MLRGWLKDNVSTEVSEKTRIIYGGMSVANKAYIIFGS